MPEQKWRVGDRFTLEVEGKVAESYASAVYVDVAGSDTQWYFPLKEMAKAVKIVEPFVVGDVVEDSTGFRLVIQAAGRPNDATFFSKYRDKYTKAGRVAP